MRLALIADIHGNLPALDAVLAEIDREGVDRLVCLGDISVGPQPVETLERVRSLGCPVILGNWDAWFVEGAPHLNGKLASVLLELHAWSAGQFSREQREYLGGFEPLLEVPLTAGESLLAFHGSPQSYEDMILATTPDQELERMFAGRSALVLAGGHTHFQLCRRFGESLLVNPGSVGLPFRRRREGVMGIAPWAEYGLVDHDGGRLSDELRRTTFDVEGFLETMRSTGMPHADWWASLWTEEHAAL
jgi:predicted phosphodiesterase